MSVTLDFAEIRNMIAEAAHDASSPKPMTGSLPNSGHWTELIDALLKIRSLEEDWDGQGASAPSPALVDGAIRFAQDFEAKGIDAADRVVASVNGTVYFEWHRPGGYIEIEVTAPDVAEARCVKAGSDNAQAITFSCHK